ncbi:alkaline phosphatase PhoX [Hyalangium gracile]|uniref:alkaline phosphatase PhoX n=1 Tax=Hyalangium gracile TaxID=394092 RepID=UPI001CCF2D43|nr:alkaline phosphatase PhoX [Hyalangium gracile]
MSPRPLLNRRALLRAGASLALPFALGRCHPPESTEGLEPDPAGILDLPEGFSYRILERRGALMDDGFRVPGQPDGMGCFAGPAGSNTLVLMRNHELEPGQDAMGPFTEGQRPDLAYRPEELSPGGVTRVVVDATTFTRLSSNLVLAGSMRNCAGGTSPWGWLSCEETLAEGHGYVFLCDPAASSLRAPVPIPGLGRMNHEAAVVDPESFVTYLTEDRNDSCFYRFVPETPGARLGPESRGRLQALRIESMPRAVSAEAKRGDTFRVDWVDLPSPSAQDDTLRRQGVERGAALFRRGEGLFLHGGAVFFCATTGGPQGGGQIWRYQPEGLQGGRLELLAQAEERGLLDMPDNLCVAPWGDVVLAEDGDNARWPNEFLRILTPSGEVRNLARGALGSGGEFAGVCFSPDGRALFANMQSDGLTLVITGPFQEYTGTAL